MHIGWVLLAAWALFVPINVLGTTVGQPPSLVRIIDGADGIVIARIVEGRCEEATCGNAMVRYSLLCERAIRGACFRRREQTMAGPLAVGDLYVFFGVGKGEPRRLAYPLKVVRVADSLADWQLEPAGLLLDGITLRTEPKHFPWDQPYFYVRMGDVLERAGEKRPRPK